MKYHHDRNPGDDFAEAKVKEIALAYDALSNSETRAVYDALPEGKYETLSSLQRQKIYQKIMRQGSTGTLKAEGTPGKNFEGGLDLNEVKDLVSFLHQDY